MRDKIAILMPVFNTPVEWLKQAVESVMEQEDQFDELIVVDDGSKEQSLIRFLRDISEIDNILVINNKYQHGIGRSLNIGLQQSNADIIIRMDSDDIARGHLVETWVKFMNDFPEVMICGCGVEFFGDQQRIAVHPNIIQQKTARLKGFWLTNHPGICFRRDWFLYDLGGYVDAGIGLPEDYPTWVNVLRSGEVIYNIQEVLVNYRSRPHKFHPLRQQWLQYWKNLL